MDWLDRLEQAVLNPMPTLKCLVPKGADVFVAHGSPHGGVMRTFSHRMKKDLRYVDFQIPAVPSENGVAFRVRKWDLRYKNTGLKFVAPKDSVLYKLYEKTFPLTAEMLDGSDFAIIATADEDYPFIICRERVCAASKFDGP